MDIIETIDHYKNLPGIDIAKLKPGTKIKVITENSAYKFEVINREQLFAEGGQYIIEPQIIEFNGSTYSMNSSMIKIGWIGQEMCMEFIINKKRITTTPVKKITILGDVYNN